MYENINILKKKYNIDPIVEVHCWTDDGVVGGLDSAGQWVEKNLEGFVASEANSFVADYLERRRPATNPLQVAVKAGWLTSNQIILIATEMESGFWDNGSEAFDYLAAIDAFGGDTSAARRRHRMAWRLMKVAGVSSRDAVADARRLLGDWL